MSASKVNATLSPVRGPWLTTGALVPMGVAPGTLAPAAVGDGTPVDGGGAAALDDAPTGDAPTDGAMDGVDDADEPTKTGWSDGGTRDASHPAPARTANTTTRTPTDERITPPIIPNASRPHCPAPAPSIMELWWRQNACHVPNQAPQLHDRRK
ncbi:hypothetical protein [Micromonospora chokoriensis]|uniref:hypothetical protein n=1 Tax=Micromonospora chokoriensis TaxID=356851 RepID=UPI0012FE5D4D|nr:hypothetical protein [Micromonospora chokoriensis]